MKERGFLPLTAVGLILLVISVSVSGYYRWNTHQSEMESINDSASSSLVTGVASKRIDLRRQAEEALNDALWEAGKNDDIPNESRENWAECLAGINLEKRLSSLADNPENRPLNPHLNLENSGLDFNLERSDGVYPRARVELPVGTSFSDRLPDNSFLVSLPSENIEASSESRFYLMKDRMSDFGDGLEEIEDRWKYAEYAMAYAQAWAGKKLSLSKERSRALFQLSLASREIDKFGSSDYQAIIKDLTGISSSDQVIEGYDPDVVVEPIQEGEIQEMTGRVDNSLSLIGNSASKLQASVSDLKEVKEFQPKNWIEEKRKKFSRLKERIDNAGTEFLKREFRGVCEDFESVYTFPADQVSKTHQKIREAKKFTKKARTQFQDALNLMEELSQGNPMIKQLHEDFTEEKNPPGVAFQVETGLDDVLEDIGDFENRVNSLEDSLRVSNDLTRDFPADFRSRFREALESEDRELADEILSEAMDSASQAFEDFEESIKNGLDRANSVYHYLDNMVERQTQEPKPNWKKGYKEYPDPSEDYDEEPEEETAEKYVIRSENGTIGGLEKVIKNASSHLDLLENMGGEFEKKREDLKKFEIEDDLREKLRGEINYKIPKNLSREESYELSPPEPLRSDPGLSVYHEVEIEDVKYEREDPAGRVYDSAPTPIYLWFIGVTLYWAQWDVKIELKEPLLEEIFDYKNQTILRPFSKESRIYVHKPLPFREEFQKSEFGFRLIVVSLRPFSISSG